MNTRRTTGNRRKSVHSAARHHFLELNVRTASMTRQRYRKAGGLLWKIFSLIILLALLAVGSRFAIEKFFFQNAEYSLKHLETHLNGIMTQEELVALTGFSMGKNLFRLDLDEAERKLTSISEVRAASVERILPDTIRISLDRRIPVFLIAGSGVDEGAETFLPGKSFLCDRDGVIMHAARLDQEFINLPVLYGVDRVEASLGKRLENERLAFAIRLQEALSKIPEESFKIRSIDVSKSYAAVVKDASNALFTFGNNDLPSQLERLRKLLAHCQETGRKLETANLIVAHNTPVTFVLTPETRSTRITPLSIPKKNTLR